MKVLYIVTAYDRQPGDGITPWLVQTIRRLRTRGIDVEVLAPSYRGRASGPVEGVMVHRFRYAPAPLERLTHEQTAPDRIRDRPGYLALVPGYVISSMLRARALARTGEYDLVHAHWPLPHALPAQAARAAAGLPLVLTFHGVEVTFARNSPLPFLVPFLRRAVRTADAVTANSSYTAGLIRGLHDRPVDVIPFGSTIEGVATDGEVRAGGAPFRLLFVGRLVERKGVHYLLDALARSVEPGAFHLDVVGDGPMRQALVQRAAELGLEDLVTFHGFVPDDALARHYAAADAFVLPAAPDAKGDVEGLGVVLIEAASFGLPLIASAAGGITDIVLDGETGLLVPPGDPAALAGAIARLAGDPERTAGLGAAARAHVETTFGWDRIMDELERLYRRLVGHGLD